ncbi:jg21388 [Pararge aegeria aegeria]|uniref:Jg21388 protein n=1 Tax=Pararge aegeria aegeria TaxID=348720 RepID=A0A8S4RXJ6_9NEOP|nr:jg21388 [Pararge aegeria aegeria]
MNLRESDGFEAMLVIITGKCGHDREKQCCNYYLSRIVNYVTILRNPFILQTKGVRCDTVMSANLSEGLLRALWSRARVHQPGTAAVFQQLPTLESCLQKQSNSSPDLLLSTLSGV